MTAPHDLRTCVGGLVARRAPQQQTPTPVQRRRCAVRLPFRVMHLSYSPDLLAGRAGSTMATRMWLSRKSFALTGGRAVSLCSHPVRRHPKETGVLAELGVS